MFKKIVIANRGEIAVRIIQTCREMGIPTVALYELVDRNSLHVRLADECVMLPNGFRDFTQIIDIAKQQHADAIHPGYGFFAEDPAFVRACNAAGIKFIGPSAEVLAAVHDKLAALDKVRAAGIRAVVGSMPDECLDESQLKAVQAKAEAIGYPLVIKSCYGGRGPGEKLVRRPEQLPDALRAAAAESFATFGTRTVYLEKALLPVNLIGVQILADQYGNLVHLGEHEGSLQYNHRKLVEEAPAPCLSREQREALWAAALKIARLFNLQNANTVEFLVDGDGNFYFTEVKARLQTEHPLIEMLTRIDLVREQIRIAAGETLSLHQEQVHLHGHALLCRIHADDPLNQMRASPGKVTHLHMPSGSGLRVDSYLHILCEVPATYNSMIAKLTTWGSDRSQAISIMRRALQEVVISGMPTNIPFIQTVINTPEFQLGAYTTETVYHHRPSVPLPDPDVYYRDLAVTAALLHVLRHHQQAALTPERVQSGWYRSSRRLSE